MGKFGWVGLIFIFSSFAHAEKNQSTLLGDINQDGLFVYNDDFVEVVDGQPITSESLDENGNAIIYLNRCVNGCVVRQGSDSSIENTSFIPRRSNSLITQFQRSDDEWSDVVDCVKAKFEGYKAVIVEEDPGSASHFEAIVAGAPDEIGLGNPDGGRLGGIAPFGCGGLHNALSFSFANTLSSTKEICEVVAHEVGHTLGLQHQYQCEDPMTYLQGCGDKWFQDSTQSCGTTDGPERCSCGSSTQNTHEVLLSRLGESDESPPEMTFTKPIDNALVSPGFGITVKAIDNVYMNKVELYVNGELQKELTSGPFAFNSPEGLSGEVVLEARGYDNRNTMNSTFITVDIADSCNTQSDCESEQVCLKGYCAKGETLEGGLGSICESNLECDSRKCLEVEDRLTCSVSCNAELDPCPSGFACVESLNGNVCASENPIAISGSSDSKGGCNSTNKSSNNTRNHWMFSFFMMALIGLKVRRKTLK